MANRGKRSNGEGQILYDKRRKNYRARVTIGWELDEENGKYKQIIKSLGTYKTKGEAASALADFLKSPYDINKKDITFKELYELWFEEFIKDHESHRYRIKSAYKYCSSLYNKKFKEITILDMKHCINNGTCIGTKGKYKGIEQPASPSVKESIKYIFNHIYSYAIEARIVDHNYAKDFSLDKKIFIQKNSEHKNKIPFTQEEMDKLWKSIEFIPFADMIIYACYSGWRPRELCELKISNINIEENYIIGGIKTSAGKNRIVPIHPKVKNIIKKYYDNAIKYNSEFLFNDIEKKKGIGLSYDQYLSRFNKVMNMLNFRKEITPHYTRHTFITKAKYYGVNEYILKLIVGHEIGDLTEHVYTHREIDELMKEISKIEKKGNA